MFYDYFVTLLALGRLAVTVLMGNVAPPPDRIPNLDYSVHEEGHVCIRTAVYRRDIPSTPLCWALIYMEVL